MKVNKSKYFRISLTDNCNLNCYFCHNEGQERSKSLKAFLSADDIIWTAQCAKVNGYSKFKLTGGEPSRHPEIIQIIKGISDLQVEDLSMITNGYKLYDNAMHYKNAGLHRLNVSLYTLNPMKFKKKNGGSALTLKRVINGIDEALKIGFTNMKLNYVWDGVDNYNDFMEICDFSGKRSLTVVLLPIMAYKNVANQEEITLMELSQLLVRIGVTNKEVIIDNEGIKKELVTLNSGAKILIRLEELKEKYPYNHCITCESKSECREGIFPTRLSAKGILYPCLADTGNSITLVRAIKMRDQAAIQSAFQMIREY